MKPISPKGEPHATKSIIIYQSAYLYLQALENADCDRQLKKRSQNPCAAVMEN